MASARELSASPDTGQTMTDEESKAFQEGRFCRPCRKIFKVAGHLDQHHKTASVHASDRTAPQKAGLPEGAVAVKPGERVFFSPKSNGLRIVVPGHQGEYQQVGKTRRVKRTLAAEFKSGLFKTTNQKIIAYLTKDYQACAKFNIRQDPDDPDSEVLVYNDQRWPVFEQGQLRDMAMQL